MNIIDVLKSKTDLLNGKGASEDDISLAQQELGLHFSDEYKEYLSVMAIAAYGGHELTGLIKSHRTNVVDVTKKKRVECMGILDGWYTIEDANMDLIVIWQQSDGKIYRTVGKNEPILIAESMSDYITGC